MYGYNKDTIKNSLTLEQVYQLLTELEGEPEIVGTSIISRTICHNGNSRKLYYYDNTHLFKCFTDCGETFDVFQLIQKIKQITLSDAIRYIANYFNFSKEENTNESYESNKADWLYIENQKRIQDIDISSQEVSLKEYDSQILTYMPIVRVDPWEQEGITFNTLLDNNIKYNPINHSVVIPHYDINNRLVGIRERTLIKENEGLYGKYRPAFIHKQLYNHPLSFNLYNLNNSKENIKVLKKAILFEGEKSALKYQSFFGRENDISVASCGSSFIQYQAWLLINLGVEEIIVAYDKQYQELHDKDYEKLINNLIQIHRKYGQYVKISYLFDFDSLLDFKDAPIDKGKETFLKLVESRVDIYNAM